MYMAGLDMPKCEIFLGELGVHITFISVFAGRFGDDGQDE